MQDEEIVFEAVRSPEGGYDAHARGYSIFTQADSLEELDYMVRDAVECHFDEGQRPSRIRIEFADEPRRQFDESAG